MIEIQTLKSQDPLNSYAPHWDIKFGVATWDDNEKIEKLKKYLLKKEDDILKMEPGLHDGATGLGYESVTARFGKYNLFDFIDEEETLGDLLKWLQKQYLKKQLN